MILIRVIPLFFLLNGLRTVAQAPFTGIIEYTVNDTKHGSDGPVKMIMTRTPEKILVRMIFKDVKKEERVLINTLNDSLYYIDPHRKTYSAISLNDDRENDLSMIRTDSARNILGHNCRGYKIVIDEDAEGFAWIAENMGGLRRQYPWNANMAVTGNKYVMLGFDDFWKNDKRSVITAVSIKKMNNVPRSVFDISGLTPKTTEPAEE